MATVKRISPPSPPRLTGDLATDMVALREWMWGFFNVTVVETGLLDPVFQSTAGTFDPANLPDPAATSIAKAQDTANHAYRLLPIFAGLAVLNDPNNVLTFTFAQPQPNANYRVVPVPVDFSGSPSSSAFLVTRITKTTKSFTITLAAAPGPGTSVTYDLTVLPSA